MARTFLVDAHNALYRLYDPAPESPDVGRRAVIDRAKEALRARGGSGTGERAHLVFDTAAAGKHRAGSHGRDGAVSWSYADGSADEEILRLVRGNDAKDEGARLVVVTDDRELRGRTAQLGAAVLRVHEFFSARDARPGGLSAKGSPPLTPADFGFTDDAIDLDRVDPDDL